MAESVGKTDYQSLITTLDNDLKEVKPLAQKPKVLFIYARGANMLMVAGKDTPFQKIVELAGGTYAVTDFTDFKPLTSEAVVKANPDVLLVFDSGLQSLGGDTGLLALPGISQTNAGKNKQIIAMEGGYLSGFGPRLGKAAAELNKKLAEVK